LVLSVQIGQLKDNNRVTGYLHPRYAASLAQFGRPRELPACGGWIVERQIPGCSYRDAMGCYPLFSCRDWSQLAEDLEPLEGELVSLALVTDPFGDFLVDELRLAFDVCFVYKEHFVSDLSKPIEDIVTQKWRRKEARCALRDVTVQPCLEPYAYLDEWTRLYSCLIERHDIEGIRAFSREAFAEQLSVPGVVYFRVLCDGQPVGGDIFYVQDDVAYNHLSAFSDQGYALNASSAVNWVALKYFADRVRWLAQGAGTSRDNSDGLAYFKSGWSTGMRPVYFCGRILDREKYAELSSRAQMPNSTYFPIYRAGEFA
jgi:hypothetical protein